MMLHIINKSCSESMALRECLEFIEAGSSVLLIENAVLTAKACVNTRLVETPPMGVQFYVLEPDLRARGISAADCYPHIQCVGYDGFVALVAENNPVKSWF